MPHPNSLANLRPTPPWTSEQAKEMSRLAKLAKAKLLSFRIPEPSPDLPQNQLTGIQGTLAHVLYKESQRHPKYVNLKRIGKTIALIKQSESAKGTKLAKASTEPIQSLTPGARPKNPPL